MNALHINGNDLTLEAVREVAVERRPVLLAAEARERCKPGARRGGRAGGGKPRVLRHHHRRRQVERCAHCGRADSRASGQPGALACGGCRRSAIRRRDAGHDVVARELAFQGALRRTQRGHRHDLRDAESRRHADGAVARQRGSQRRSGAAGASGAGADRRRRMSGRQRVRAFLPPTRCGARR